MKKLVCKSIIVSYDAIENVLDRLLKRGALLPRSGQFWIECYIIGKLAKIEYWVPSEQAERIATRENHDRCYRDYPPVECPWTEKLSWGL